MNEKWVEYLFSRFHHLLGFEKVIKFQSAFPDVTALKKGREVRIELESNLSGVKAHYYIDKPNSNGFEEVNGHWMRVSIVGDHSQALLNYPNPGKKEHHKEYESMIYPDQNDNVYVARKSLRRKSLAPLIDIIVCWKIDKYPLQLKKDPNLEDIEVIELRSRLRKLGVSW